MSKPIRILIVEDQPIYVEGLYLILEDQSEIEIVGSVPNGKLALEFLEKHKVDVILLDINMPVMNGYEVSPIILENYPEIKIVMLTIYDNPETIFKMIDIGVSGYLLKESSRLEIMNAIKQVAEDDHFFSSKVLSLYMREKRRLIKLKQNSSSLTKTEKLILSLVVQGFTSSEIANIRHNDKETINTHRRNIMAKLGVRNTASLVREAILQRLVDLDELDKA